MVLEVGGRVSNVGGEMPMDEQIEMRKGERRRLRRRDKANERETEA